MSIDNLLSRLDRVKPTSPNTWLACCPSHPDKTPSLSVRKLDDGRILIHCFGGCSVENILSAVGLEFSDLYPPKPILHAKPERRPFPALDVLTSLAHEVAIVACAAGTLQSKGTLEDDECERLALAHARIQSGLSLAIGGATRHAPS